MNNTPLQLWEITLTIQNISDFDEFAVFKSRLWTGQTHQKEKIVCKTHFCGAVLDLPKIPLLRCVAKVRHRSRTKRMEREEEQQQHFVPLLTVSTCKRQSTMFSRHVICVKKLLPEVFLVQNCHSPRKDNTQGSALEKAYDIY